MDDSSVDGSGVSSSADEDAPEGVEAAGPEALVRQLIEQHPRLQGLPDALDLLKAADRLTSWVAAQQAELIAQVHHHVNGHEMFRTGQQHPGTGFTYTAQEIAPLLRVPGRTAQQILSEALTLCKDLPATWEALEAGTLSPVQAQVIVQESGTIPAEAIPGYEEQILDTAATLTRPKLAQRCRRLREELHPESIIERRKRAAKDRDVTIHSEQDGMAWLGAYLPAEQAHGIFNRVNTAARALQSPDEPRTLNQLRADVFTDVLTHTCTGDPKNGTGHRGVGANVFLTVPVMTLLGHRKQDWQNATGSGVGGSSTTTGDAAGSTSKKGTAGNMDAPAGSAMNSNDPTGAGAGGPAGAGTGGTGHDGQDPLDSDVNGFHLNGADLNGADSGAGVPDLEGCTDGHLDGYGPIDPETARNLAAHAPSFTRILVHPETGAVLSVGRDRYRPPKHLQDWVRITHPTCIHPGCNRSSWTSEIDHTIPWAHGGTTELSNLAPRCKLHHTLKTDGIWADFTTDPSGAVHSTSLAGKTYTTLPEPPPPF
ncbi:HNH endonuclease signature motif containing protein [Arthrobacter pigmenti]|uniref:HNH endonuclease signature motif containing protein n=1 Tax=Arthrobacter pigmenti TaxID=271432 RepID=UPI001ADA2C34